MRQLEREIREARAHLHRVSFIATIAGFGGGIVATDSVVIAILASFVSVTLFSFFPSRRLNGLKRIQNLKRR